MYHYWMVEGSHVPGMSCMWVKSSIHAANQWNYKSNWENWFWNVSSHLTWKVEPIIETAAVAELSINFYTNKKKKKTQQLKNFTSLIRLFFTCRFILTSSYHSCSSLHSEKKNRAWECRMLLQGTDKFQV